MAAGSPDLAGTRTSDLPLYREPEIRMAVAAGERVVLVESESSADALCRAGVYSTTGPAGQKRRRSQRIAAVLGQADVLIVADHDESRLRCLRRLRSALPTADTLLPAPGLDARDHLAIHRAICVHSQNDR